MTNSILLLHFCSPFFILAIINPSILPAVRLSVCQSVGGDWWKRSILRTDWSSRRTDTPTDSQKLRCWIFLFGILNWIEEKEVLEWREEGWIFPLILPPSAILAPPYAYPHNNACIPPYGTGEQPGNRVEGPPLNVFISRCFSTSRMGSRKFASRLLERLVENHNLCHAVTVKSLKCSICYLEAIIQLILPDRCTSPLRLYVLSTGSLWIRGWSKANFVRSSACPRVGGRVAQICK